MEETMTEVKEMTMKDSTGREVPVRRLGQLFVLDFENQSLYERMEGEIILIPNSGTRFRSTQVRRFTDVNSNITYGIPTGNKTKQGEWEFEAIPINRRMTFDLSKKRDRQRWEIMKMAPNVVESPLGNEKTSTLKILDKESDNIKSAQKASQIKEGLENLERMDSSEMRGMHMLMGGNPESMSEGAIRGAISEFIIRSPEKFRSLYDSENKGIEIVFHEALSLGLLIEDREKGWLFEGGQSLGYSKDSAIRFLKKDTHLMNAVVHSIELRKKNGPLEKKISEDASNKNMHPGILDEKLKELSEVKSSMAKEISEYSQKNKALEEKSKELDEKLAKINELLSNAELAKKNDEVKKEKEEEKSKNPVSQEERHYEFEGRTLQGKNRWKSRQELIEHIVSVMEVPQEIWKPLVDDDAKMIDICKAVEKWKSEQVDSDKKSDNF